VRVAAGEAANLGSVGDYGWAGAYGTTFFIDPKERLIAIWMMQRPNLPARVMRAALKFSSSGPAAPAASPDR